MDKNMQTRLLTTSFILLLSLVFFISPTVRASDKNLAPMFQGETCYWGDYNTAGAIYYGDFEPPHQIAFKDDIVLHNGHSSIRVEKQNEYNPYREVNAQMIIVHPNDRIVFKCWVKTDALSSGNGLGGIIGFDVFGSTDRLLEGHPRNPQTGIWDYPQTGTPIYVPYGSDWTLLTIDTVVPETYYTHDFLGKVISPQQVVSIIPWVGGSWHSQADYTNVWFADAELYINPTGHVANEGVEGVFFKNYFLVEVILVGAIVFGAYTYRKTKRRTK